MKSDPHRMATSRPSTARYQILQMTAKLQAQNRREKASSYSKNYQTSLVSRLRSLHTTFPADGHYRPVHQRRSQGSFDIVMQVSYSACTWSLGRSENHLSSSLIAKLSQVGHFAPI